MRSLRRFTGWLVAALIIAHAGPGSGGQVSDQHAVFATEEIRIAGSSMEITGDVHANRSVRIEGRDIRVRGALEAGDDVRTEGTNILAASVLPRSSALTMPAIDFGLLRQTAVEVRPGDTRLSGLIVLRGTIYAQGNASVQGVVAGTGWILAEGDLVIEATGVRFPMLGSAAYVAARRLTIRGSGLALHGLFVAPNGDLEIQGDNIHLRGVVMARRVRINGSNIRIDFDPTVRMLLNPGVSPPSGTLNPPVILQPRDGAILKIRPDLYVGGTTVAEGVVQFTLRQENSGEVLATGRVQADASGRFNTLLRVPSARIASTKHVLTAVVVHPAGWTSSPASVAFLFERDLPP